MTALGIAIPVFNPRHKNGNNCRLDIEPSLQTILPLHTDHKQAALTGFN